MHYIHAVSYTHLDVYKRQRYRVVRGKVQQSCVPFTVRQFERWKKVTNQCAWIRTPVSYTHLDVYKRQVSSSRPRSEGGNWSMTRILI